MIKNKGKYYTDIIDRLTKVYRKEVLFKITNLLLKGLAFIMIWILFLSLLEMIFRFNSEVRTILFYLTLSLFVIAVPGIPLFIYLKNIFSIGYREIYKTALKTGEYYKEITDDLLNAIQLLDNPGKNYSADLINASFETVYKKCLSLNFNEIIKPDKIIKTFRMLLVSIFALSALFFTNDFRTSFSRLVDYNTEYIIPPRITFEITPGNVSVTRGEKLVIEAKIVGEFDSPVNINIKNQDQSNFENKKIAIPEEGVYKYKISSVISPFEYYVECDGFESDKYVVTVLNRPIIKSLKLVITPPSYSGLQQTVQLDNGSINALKGSRVKLELRSSKKLSDAKLKFPGSESALECDANEAFTNFTITKSNKYSILLRDENGIESSNPVEYEINILPDFYPEIELVKPGDKLRIASDQVITLSHIYDDFGFQKLNLSYRLSASQYETPSEDFSILSISIDKKTLDQEIHFVWDISDLFLAEGDVVSYYFEVFDNDNVSGPKSTKSNIQTLVVPSVNEYFEEADKIQDTAQKDLKTTFDEAQKLQEEMQKLSNELKRDEREITFEEKQKLENSLSKYEELSKKAADVAEQLKQMQQDLMQNDLLSEETMQKYMELQNLMKELEGNEFLKALREMQEQMQNLMRNQSQENLENMKMNENAFKENLERTLNLLKRLQVEQKVDEMIKRSENIKDKAGEMQDKLENNQSDKNNLSKRQEDLKEELQSYKESMENLKEKMNELDNMPMDKLEEIKEQFEQQKNEQLADSLGQNIEDGDKQTAQNQMQQMSNNMQQMSQMFSEMQKEMNSKMQMETFYDMAKVLNELIYLSRQEENLKNKTESLTTGSEEIKNLTEEQSKLGGDLDKIVDHLTGLSKKSFSVTPEMGKAIGDSKGNMMQAQAYMQNNFGSSAISKQRDAMKNLNEAADLLKGAMNQMMNSSGGGGGMMSLMQQLKKMGQQQMDINQMTQMMMQERQAQQQMAQMQKLAQQQEGVRKSLQELNKEARESGESSKLAGSLEKILEEMKEVVKDMNSGSTDNQLLQKQERILSRLLEAQHSMNERDFEEKRESTTGQNIYSDTPGALNLSNDSNLNVLKEELKKAMQQGYKKDYEELIRKYFEALEKELKN